MFDGTLYTPATDAGDKAEDKRPSGRLSRLFHRWAENVARERARRHSTRILASLSSETLRDIGVERYQISSTVEDMLNAQYSSAAGRKAKDLF